jgi:hypothetical protein
MFLMRLYLQFIPEKELRLSPNNKLKIEKVVLLVF